MKEKRIINKFIGGTSKLEFGDYILFQEYVQGLHDGIQYHCTISKPIMAIYLGCFIADQTIGFNYVRWNNDRHSVYITNEYVTRYRTCKEVKEIESHIEWCDVIDILGHWKQKPNWKDIIKSYRKQNTEINMKSDEIVW
jgi:hypothetical protein